MYVIYITEISILLLKECSFLDWTLIITIHRQHAGHMIALCSGESVLILEIICVRDMTYSLIVPEHNNRHAL